MKVVKTVLLAFVTFMTCGSSCKGDKTHEPPPPTCRSLGEARVESARILRSPVICEGESVCKDSKVNGGFICADGRGGLTTCSPDSAKPCMQHNGPAELPLPLDAGIARD